jgi:hypothetical protein
MTERADYYKRGARDENRCEETWFPMSPMRNYDHAKHESDNHGANHHRHVPELQLQGFGT